MEPMKEFLLWSCSYPVGFEIMRKAEVYYKSISRSHQIRLVMHLITKTIYGAGLPLINHNSKSFSRKNNNPPLR